MIYIRNNSAVTKYVIYDKHKDAFVKVAGIDSLYDGPFTYVTDVNDATFCNDIAEVSCDLANIGLEASRMVSILSVNITLDAMPDFTQDFSDKVTSVRNGVEEQSSSDREVVEYVNRRNESAKASIEAAAERDAAKVMREARAQQKVSARTATSSQTGNIDDGDIDDPNRFL